MLVCHVGEAPDGAWTLIDHALVSIELLHITVGVGTLKGSAHDTNWLFRICFAPEGDDHESRSCVPFLAPHLACDVCDQLELLALFLLTE